MQKRLNIAVVGATGLVGETMLEILHERCFPYNEVYAVASSNSAGDSVLMGNKNLTVHDIATFDFSKVDIALFSAGGNVSAKYAPLAAAKGCVVIDNTSNFRYEADVPLIVPEINSAAIAGYVNRNIIANPNCSTIQMLVALNPIHKKVGIKKITVATYQSVSGSGRAAISELITQATELLNGKPPTINVYPQQIAFNVIPHIDIFLDNGFSKEEMKMVWETHKILADDKIVINATTVRVPVIYGHSLALTVETDQPIPADVAKELLGDAPGIKIIDNVRKAKYPTPISDAIGKDEVLIGRIRNGVDDMHTLNLWVVADNIRKGAALNSIQIAELLVAKYLRAD